MNAYKKTAAVFIVSLLCASSICLTAYAGERRGNGGHGAGGGGAAGEQRRGGSGMNRENEWNRGGGGGGGGGGMNRENEWNRGAGSSGMSRQNEWNHGASGMNRENEWNHGSGGMSRQNEWNRGNNNTNGLWNRNENGSSGGWNRPEENRNESAWGERRDDSWPSHGSLRNDSASISRPSVPESAWPSMADLGNRGNAGQLRSQAYTTNGHGRNGLNAHSTGTTGSTGSFASTGSTGSLGSFGSTGVHGANSAGSTAFNTTGGYLSTATNNAHNWGSNAGSANIPSTLQSNPGTSNSNFGFEHRSDDDGFYMNGKPAGGRYLQGASNSSSSSNWQDFREDHPRRAEVLSRDNNLNNEIQADKGNLGGHYNQLEREDQAIRQQEQADAKFNGGYITRGEQRQLNHEENGLQRQINHDDGMGHPTANGGGSTGNGGTHTPNGSTTSTNSGSPVASNSGGESRWQDFREDHPRRAEVLSRDHNLNNEIQTDKGNLGGHYNQLEREDQAIRQQEQADAKFNGGHITRGEQRQLNHEENHLQRQINHDDGMGHGTTNNGSTPTTSNSGSNAGKD